MKLDLYKLSTRNFAFKLVCLFLNNLISANENVSSVIIYKEIYSRIMDNK